MLARWTFCLKVGGSSLGVTIINQFLQNEAIRNMLLLPKRKEVLGPIFRKPNSICGRNS